MLRKVLSLVFLIVTVFALGVAEARPAKHQPLAVLERGVASGEVDERPLAVEYSITTVGPLFALPPLVSRLGGNLKIGPLGQSHELDVAGTVFMLGPGSKALTYGETIEDLTQAPQVGVGGLHVPLDLLRRVYTRLLGFDFTWSPQQRRLEIKRRPLREIPVTLDVVSLQGVTTLVFQFPVTPRYRVTHDFTRVEVELLGDRLQAAQPRRLAADRFVRDVQVTPQKILIDLAPGTAAQEYALENPFRLVFDVVRDRGPRLPQVETPKPRRRSRRVETIIIDPGHGGRDSGALGASGTREKDLSLAIARALSTRLRQALPVRTVLTRTGDEDLPLDSRSALANQHKGDLFISVHLNSSFNPNSTGAETYFLSLDASDEAAAAAARAENRAGGGGEDPLYDLQLMLWDMAQSRYLAGSQRLATLVQEELNSALGLRNRGVKQAPFRVLVGTAMPAILVELGFLNNAEEEVKLNRAEYRGQLVEALVRAVRRYVAAVDPEAVAGQESPQP